MGALCKILNGLGETGPVQGKKVNFSISGEFAATWEITRKVAGKDDVVATGDGKDSGFVDNGDTSLPVRVKITAYTSGTIDVAMEA